MQRVSIQEHIKFIYMKKALLTLLTVASCLFAYSTNATLNVYKLAHAPRVDGVITDWGSNWKDLSNSDATSTTTGCTAQFQTGYTNDSLYIVIKVQDATAFTYDAAVATYLRDCIEAFVHIDTTTIVTGFTAGSTQFRMQRVQEAYNSGDANGVAAHVVSVDSPTGYTQEWAIAWTDIAAKESFEIPANGIDALPIPYIRFDIKAADNTTGTDRTQQIFWSTPSDNGYTTMADMGTLHLMGVRSGVSKVEANSTKVYYSATKDGLTVLDYIGDVSIYNVVGKLVLKTNVKSYNESINLSSLNKGVYLVSGTGLSSKFIK